MQFGKVVLCYALEKIFADSRIERKIESFVDKTDLGCCLRLPIFKMKEVGSCGDYFAPSVRETVVGPWRASVIHF